MCLVIKPNIIEDQDWTDPLYLSKLANSDFSKMSTEQIKLNITGRLKYLNIHLNPKTK